MSSRNAVCQDSLKSSPNTSFETQATPLRPQLVSDSAILLPPPPPPPPQQQQQQQQQQIKQQIEQQDTNTLPQAFSDEVLVRIPLTHLEDAETPLDIEGDIPKIDGDTLEIDEDEDDMSTKDLALIYRTRRKNREPPPGTIRVLKKVRVRKQESTSKRRSKKQTLRVQLQKQDRIEEEMAQFRGKGKVKVNEPKSGRRYIPTDPVIGLRPPSSLRFSESCNYEEEEEDLENDDSSILPRDLEVSMEYSPDASVDRIPSSVA